MPYFDNDFIRFFEELAKNNNKEWFDSQRKRYEQSVKKPFSAFVEEMINRIAALDPEVQIQAKDATMRINRDIRFSPDKTPYNTHYGAIISAGGRKDKSVPGLYMRFSPEGIELYGGAHMLDKDALQRVRSAIAADIKGFQKLINKAAFSKKFSGILGEKNKRIPKEFEEAAAQEPLIANKSFYYMAKLDAKEIVSDTLPDTIMDYWRAAQPVKDFLREASKA